MDLNSLSDPRDLIYKRQSIRKKTNDMEFHPDFSTRLCSTATAADSTRFLARSYQGIL
jgi:hypothetical protein